MHDELYRKEEDYLIKTDFDIASLMWRFKGLLALECESLHNNASANACFLALITPLAFTFLHVLSILSYSHFSSSFVL